MASPSVSFEPFGGDEIDRFFSAASREFVEQLVASGTSPEDAERHADADRERYFPNGSPAPGHLVGRVVSEGKEVGRLWIGPIGSDPTKLWVFAIEIDESFRGQGLGRQAMKLAEELARENGAVNIGLNVFAQNVAARRLYESLGYSETSLQMSKDL